MGRRLDGTDISKKQRLNHLLKMAVLAGVETAVKIHIRRGDDLDARDINGLTPLMLAASKNKSVICTLLLSAGADIFLIDPLGRDALAIARDARADQAVSILCQWLPKIVEPHSVADVSGHIMGDTTFEHGSLESFADLVEIPPKLELGILDDNTDTFDLSGWEAEHVSLAPAGNEILAEAQVAIQYAIALHKPIDTFEGWGDIDTFLPERATPLPKNRGEEGGLNIRRLILRGYREGSVPEVNLQELCANKDGDRNEESEGVLYTVLGEANSGTDERIEVEEWTDDREESEIEGEEISKLLEFLENLTSTRHEPLTLYLKEASKRKLLSSEEELYLAREMEEGMSCALDVLASWPDGLSAVLAKAERMIKGAVSGNALAQLSAELEELSVDNTTPQEDEFIADTIPQSIQDVQGRIENIRKYVLYAGRGGLEEKALRKALTSANLPKAGLFELASSAAKVGADDLATKFSQAMSRYIEARERMTVCNLRLVLHLAQRFRAKGLSFDDLVQEGNLGLLKAVERFDWRRGFRFSTYATWWIRQQLQRALANDGKTIRTPVHINNTILRIVREANVMEGKEGKKATAEALAERLCISSEKVSNLLLCVYEPLPIHELGQDGVPPAEFVEDYFSPDPFEIVARDNAWKTILNIVADLDPRTVQVLNLRFGLGNDDALTLEEVGTHFDLTRERIRQIEVNGLLALRARAERLFCGTSLTKNASGELPRRMYVLAKLTMKKRT